MCICNDCKNKCDVGLVRGVSDLAGGQYYSGPEICEGCMALRREGAIIMAEAAAQIDIVDRSFYHEC